MNYWKPYGKHKRENNPKKKEKRRDWFLLGWNLALCARALHSFYNFYSTLPYWIFSLSQTCLNKIIKYHTPSQYESLKDMNCKNYILSAPIEDGFRIFLWHAQSTFFHFLQQLTLDGKHMWFQKLQHHLHNRHFWSIGKSPIASSYWGVQPNHTYNYKLLRHLKCLHSIPIFVHYPMNIESFGTEQSFRVSKIWFFSLHFPVHSFLLCSHAFLISFSKQLTGMQ